MSACRSLSAGLSCLARRKPWRRECRFLEAAVRVSLSLRTGLGPDGSSRQTPIHVCICLSASCSPIRSRKSYHEPAIRSSGRVSRSRLNCSRKNKPPRRQGRQGRRQVRNFPLPGHGKGKGLAFTRAPIPLGGTLGVPAAMTVQKGPRDRNIIPLIFILRCFKSLFFPCTSCPFISMKQLKMWNKTNPPCVEIGAGASRARSVPKRHSSGREPPQPSPG